MKKHSLHPACKLFPQLPKEELRQLAADIKANGLQNSIVLYEGQILDGRNRWLACKIAKVKPTFVQWKGSGSPVAWVISENLVRRHLTSSQRAVVALDILPLLEKEAGERQTSGKKLPKVSADGKGKASQIAAQLTKSNSAYVAVLKAVSKAAPELIEKVRAGNISVPDAKRLSEIPKEKRNELLRAVNGKSHNGEFLREWKSFSTPKAPKPVHRAANDRKSRIEATTLIHGDCCKRLKEIASKSVDCVITDPIYPEVKREYGRITEVDWHSLMQNVVAECRRILKPKGSAIFIVQPNYEKVGKMSSWLWEFLAWASKEWNIVQDVHWWNVTALPTHSTNRTVGLLRQSMKMCVWLGEPNCYRNQDAVLWEPADSTKAQAWSDRCLRNLPSGHQVRRGRIGKTAIERDGSTPFNILPIPAVNPAEHQGHPAATPYELAAWWCRYLLPAGGTLLDPFCGSGTMLLAALDHGASRVIGIDREKKYLTITQRRITKG